MPKKFVAFPKSGYSATAVYKEGTVKGKVKRRKVFKGSIQEYIRRKKK